MVAKKQESVRMLLIDSHNLTTHLDREGYKRVGVQVTLAKSLDDAYLNLEKKIVEVIVINHDSQDLNPLNMLVTLKRHPKYQQIPIIVTSVMSSEAVQKKIISHGADLFVEQPIPRNIFIEKIKSLLAKQVRKTNRIVAEDLGHVTFKYKEENQVCQLKDISSSGMLVAFGVPIQKGTFIKFKVESAILLKPINLSGEVVRHIATMRPEDGKETLTGLGIKYLSMSDSAKKNLAFLLAQLNREEETMLYYL